MHVEVDYRLSVVELCRACGVEEATLRAWVEEGVLVPEGEAEWRFTATALARARTAARLARDFEIDAPAVALALELMDEIERLRARLA